MKIIGLCGGSGSGKGALSQIMSEFGVASIDTDKIYRDMTEQDSPCLNALASEFGERIISPDGSLDRAMLRGLVFFGEGADLRLRRLNSISHAFILEKTKELLDKYRSEGYIAVLIDAPLLFESGFDKLCDCTLAVIADEDIRLRRIIERDGIDAEAAGARIRTQIKSSRLVELCDYSILNNRDISELRLRAEEILKKILDN